MQNEHDRFFELNKILPTLKGYKITRRLRSFDASYLIFNRNYNHLQALILKATRDPKSEQLLPLRNRDQLEIVQLEILRLLHNFVASASSLIDHTRVLYNELYTDKISDYQDRVDEEFKNDPLTQFIKGLRQYILHVEVPDIGITIRFSDKEGEQKNMFIPKQVLLKFSGWNSSAKKFLEENEEFDLLSIVANYQKKIKGFYDWFGKAQLKAHEKELNEFEEYQKEYFILMIKREIGAYFKNKHIVGLKEEDQIFLNIFKSSEFSLLREQGNDYVARAEKAIKLVEKHFPIEDTLKQNIRRYYKDYYSSV